MKKHWVSILMIILVLILPLSACDQSGEKTEPPTGSTQPVNQPPESYPSPEEVKLAYPEPEGEATAIEWSVAKQYILNGEIWKVILDKSLAIQLYSKDAHLYTSTAPSADEVDATVKQCGNWCEGMTYMK